MLRGRVKFHRYAVHALWPLLAACGGGAPSPLDAEQRAEELRGANATHSADRFPAVAGRTESLRRPVPSGATEFDAFELTARLVAAVDDADPSRALDAIDALGDRGDVAGIAGLQNVLYSEGRVRRHAAIRALVGIGTEDAVFALGPMLSANDEKTREAAVIALGDIGGRAALGYVQQALSDPDPDVRAEAAAVLEAEGWAQTGTPPART